MNVGTGLCQRIKGFSASSERHCGAEEIAKVLARRQWDSNLRHIIYIITVVPATAGPLGERTPALAGHFCNVPTTLPC